MANIRENKRDGKTISYRFTVCLGRDANTKQIRRYTTWEVPEGLTPAKAKKAAERAADAWERETREEYQKEKEQGQAYTLPPEKRRDSFTAFVNDVWFPLQVCNGNDKQTTVTFYKNMKKLIVKYFDGMVLQEISPLHMAWHGRKFCVNDFRQTQEYHSYDVHNRANTPCPPLSPSGWNGMRAGTA